MSNMDIFTTLIFNITITMIATTSTIITIILIIFTTIIFNITITTITLIILIFTTKDRLVPSRQQ